MGLHGCDMAWAIRVRDDDGLILAVIVPNGGFSQDIKGMTEKDIICGIFDNVYL